MVTNKHKNDTRESVYIMKGKNMKKEELQMKLESLRIYCKDKKTLKVGHLSNYSIDKLIKCFELIGINKISKLGAYHEFVMNKKEFMFFLDTEYRINGKKVSFDMCDSVCGDFEITFFIENKYNLRKCFKIKECCIIKF